MKTTLIAIENDADYSQAKALVGKLMGSRRSDDPLARMGNGVVPHGSDSEASLDQERAMALRAVETAQLVHPGASPKFDRGPQLNDLTVIFAQCLL